MAAERKSQPANQTHAIKPLPVPRGVSATTRVGVDELDPKDPNGVISTWFRALELLKAENNLDNELSYFRLAAIHGAPYVGWDGVASEGALAANGNFCTHGANTFPTWHRVYMILFENTLFSKIPDGENKKNFRMPYWDWAKNDNGSVETPLPFLLRSQVWPLGSTIENPLWKFVNPKLYDANEGTGKPPDLRPLPFGDVEMGQYVVGNDLVRNGPNSLWSITRSTSRCVAPGSPDFINGNNNMDQLMVNFRNAGWYNANPQKSHDTPPYNTISDYVYGLFSWKYSSFNSFATTAYDPVPDDKKPDYGWLSLEYLHNNLHNWIGGPDDTQIGHMNDVPVAAFDPIFWLHHTFIDALFATWQALPHNQGLWLDDESANEHLRPFHTDTNGKLFTSNDVKNIADWNYNYSNFPTTPGSGVELIKTINRKYGQSMQHVVGKAIEDKIPGAKHDYIINVLYNRHALDQAYKIHFFLGEVEEDFTSSDIMSHPNHIGSVFTFSNSGSPRCANCIKQKALIKLARAQVLLTVPLIHHKRAGLLPHLDLDHDDDFGVRKYLEYSLTWRVVKRDGTEVPIKDNPSLSDLKIILAQGKADHFPGDDTKLSIFHRDSYGTFWQGNYPGQTSEPPESFVMSNN